MFRASLFNQLGSSVVAVGMGKSILVVALRLIGKPPSREREEKIKLSCVSVARRQSTVSEVWRGVFGVLTKRLRAP